MKSKHSDIIVTTTLTIVFSTTLVCGSMTQKMLEVLHLKKAGAMTSPSHGNQNRNTMTNETDINVRTDDHLYPTHRGFEMVAMSSKTQTHDSGIFLKTLFIFYFLFFFVCFLCFPTFFDALGVCVCV